MRRGRRRVAACAAIAVGLALASWAGLAAGALAGVQRRAADAMFPRGRTDRRVVVVGIDARSIAGVGAWPWPRGRQAALVDRITAAGAAVVALDVVHAPAGPEDAVLAGSLRVAPAVVAEAVETRRGGRLDRVVHAVQPVPSIRRSAVTGHAAVAADPTDGIVRSVPLVVEQGRSFVPSLSLAALAVLRRVEPVPTLRPDGVQVGDELVPTDGRARLRVSWAAPGRALSAVDVLEGRVPPSALRGRAVFVGLTDPATGDRVLTPLDRGRGTPGVLVHAAAFDTMVQRAYLRPEARRTVVLSVVVLALAAALAVQFLPVVAGAVVAIVLAGGYLLAGVLLGDGGRLVDLVFPPLAVVATVPLSGAVRYVLEARARRRLARLLDEYVPPAIAQELLDGDRAEALLRGTGVEASVLFCDIRGFTAATASLGPTDVRRLLDRFYESVSATVLDDGGTVLRYVGDEVYAVFGAPLERADHAATAVACARRLQAQAPALAAALVEDGLPAVRYGIGVSSGPLVSTVVGSASRRQYAVIGNVVSLGARLCALAGPGEIVVSAATFDGLGPTPGWEAEPAELKGVGPAEVHRLRG